MKIAKHYIVLILLATALSSCYFIVGGGGGSGCEVSYRCSEKYYGILNLTDSSKSWLPISTDSPLVFINQFNTKSTFHQSKILHTYVNVELNNRYDYSIECKNLPCSDYCKYESQSFTYLSDDVPYKFVLERKKNVHEGSFGSNPVDTSKLSLSDDILTCTLEKTLLPFYTIPIKTSNSPLTNSTFHSSISLNSSNFYNVYECNFEGNKGRPEIYLSKVYYIIGFGIIGYQFSNNELWTRQ